VLGAGFAGGNSSSPTVIKSTPTPPKGLPTATVAAPRTITFIVANTGGARVYLRRTPTLANRDVAYSDGTRLVQNGPDMIIDGTLWHQVRAPDGRSGWVPAKFTAPLP